jgi:hypothetical protein
MARSKDAHVILSAFVLLLAATTAAGQPSPPATSQPGGDTINVHGVVLDPAGKPVAGANVTAAPNWALWDHTMPRVPLASTQSATDGRFELSFSKSKASAPGLTGGTPATDMWKWTHIVATADGYGMRWQQWDRTNAAGDVVLKLVEDEPIEGRILDHDGKGVAGVKVTADYAGAAEPEQSTTTTTAPTSAEDEGQKSLSLPRHAAGMPQPLVTDTDGKFRLTGIGRDRLVYLELSGETIGFSRTGVITRLMEPKTVISDQPTLKQYKITTYGAHFEYTPPPGRVVAGVVRDAETHQPIAGVTITPTWIEPMIWIDSDGLIESVTDEQGRYRLPSIPKAKGNRILAVPSEDQLYFMYEVDVPKDRIDAVDAPPTTIDFNLHRGVWISGKVTDKSNGQPVPARLFYSPFLNNPTAAKLPEFRKLGDGQSGMVPGTQMHYAAKGDGTFRFVGVPGPAMLGAWAIDNDRFRLGAGSDQIEVYKQRPLFHHLYQPAPEPTIINVVKQIEVAANTGASDVNLEVDPGDSIWVTATDADGKPLTGVYVDGIMAMRYANWGGRNDVKQDAPTFELRSIGPDEERTVLLRDDDRQIGKATAVRVSEVPDMKLNVKLEPFTKVTGRLVDTAGKPIAGLRLEASTKTGKAGRSLPQVFSDEHGQFTYWLLPGCDYSIYAYWNERGQFVTVTESVTAEPGAVKELGNVTLKSRGR